MHDTKVVKYPVLISFTTYHCAVCREQAMALCPAHPEARIVQQINYTDGREHGELIRRVTKVDKEPSKTNRPAEIITSTTEQPIKRKRGRPKGSKNKPKYK